MNAPYNAGQSHSHTPQIVAVIITGVMCFIAGVLSSDAVSLITSRQSSESAPPTKTIAASKPAGTPAAVAASAYELIATAETKSNDPLIQRAYSLFAEGVRLQNSGEHADAIRKYIAATELDPTLAAAFNNLGVAYSNLDSPEEAMAAFRQAGEIAPTNETAKKNLDTMTAKLSGGRQ